MERISEWLPRKGIVSKEVARVGKTRNGTDPMGKGKDMV